MGVSYTSAVERTNLVLTPQAVGAPGTAIPNWAHSTDTAAGGVIITPVVFQDATLGKVLRLNVPTSKSWNVLAATLDPAIAVTSGTTVYCTVKMRAAANTTVNLRLARINDTNRILNGSNVALTTAWQDVVLSGAATQAGVNDITLTIVLPFNTPVDVYVSSPIVTVSPSPVAYFDGDTLSANGYKYAWSGTANASASEKRKLTFTYLPDPITYTEAQYKDMFFAGEVQVTRRIEICEADGQTLWATTANDDDRLISGSISIDYSRDERRSLDVQLDNFDRALTHKPDGFWYDKTIRTYRGIKFRDAEGVKYKEYPLGTFMIDRVVQPRFPKVANITGRDFTKKAMLSKFTTTTQFATGTNVATVISALAANSGITNKLIPATSKTLGSDTTFDRGTSRWEAMKAIASAYNFELFFNASNVLVMRDFIDPTYGPLSHVFKTGPQGNLVDWDKSTNDTRIFNWVAVSGVTDTGLPVKYDAKNENPSSPTRIAKLGERVMTFDSSIVSTLSQATELGNALLSVNSLEEYEINMSSLVTPWLEAGEIAQFLDPNAALNDPNRFLMTSITMPLGLEAMTAVGRRLTIVS